MIGNTVEGGNGAHFLWECSRGGIFYKNVAIGGIGNGFEFGYVSNFSIVRSETLGIDRANAYALYTVNCTKGLVMRNTLDGGLIGLMIYDTHNSTFALNDIGSVYGIYEAAGSDNNRIFMNDVSDCYIPVLE